MGQHCSNLVNCYDKQAGGLPDQRDSIAPTPENSQKRFIMSRKDVDMPALPAHAKTAAAAAAYERSTDLSTATQDDLATM